MGFLFFMRVLNVSTFLLCLRFSSAGNSSEFPKTFPIKSLGYPSTVPATYGPSDNLLECSSLENTSETSSTQGKERMCKTTTDTENTTQRRKESKHQNKNSKINAKLRLASTQLSLNINNSLVQSKNYFNAGKFSSVLQAKRSSNAGKFSSVLQTKKSSNAGKFSSVLQTKKCSSEVAGSRKARMTKRSTRSRGASCGNWTLNPRKPLPWDCRPVKQWISLSSNYYPTYLQKTICSRSSCWYGHYNCTGVTQVINLLTRCEGECVEEDDRVPASLRTNWIFTNYELQVGCACTA